MRLLVINNLSSGLRDGAIFDFIRRFSEDGDEVVVRNTDGTTRIEDLLENAGDFDCVVAAGGDGTIASICYGLRGTGIPVLPFPAGTGNLLIMNLDQPQEPYAIAKMARDLFTVDYDLGEMSFDKGDINSEKQVVGFSMIAGAGYDASIMENSEKLKESIGPLAYVAAALSNPSPTMAHFTIRLDDEILETDGIAVLLVNFAKIYTDLSITHANNARDGFLEVVIIKPQNTVELLPALIAAFLDRSGHFPTRTDALEIHRAREVHVESDPPLTIQYDGEPTGVTTPLDARALSFSTTLVVTESEYRNAQEEDAQEKGEEATIG